jgi:hypothetical protein
MHRAVATQIAVWVTVLSPLIGLLAAFLSAWFLGQLSG